MVLVASVLFTPVNSNCEWRGRKIRDAISSFLIFKGYNTFLYIKRTYLDYQANYDLLPNLNPSYSLTIDKLLILKDIYFLI